jgi:hypothetical protein
MALAAWPRYRDQIDWRGPIEYADQTFAQQVEANGRTFYGHSLVMEPAPDQYHVEPSADGIAWEFTGQVAAAMGFVDRLYGESHFAQQAGFYRQQIAQAQSFAPYTDGRGLAAATLDAMRQGSPGAAAGAPPVLGSVTLPGASARL